jgi:hypothetical protein
MNATNDETPSPVASISESVGHNDLDPMLFDWPRIASTGWQGFLTHGRGMVVVVITTEDVGFTYISGAPCACHEELLATYDPLIEVLVAVRRGTALAVYRLAAQPTPPETWASTPGTVHGMTLQ